RRGDRLPLGRRRPPSRMLRDGVVARCLDITSRESSRVKFTHQGKYPSRRSPVLARNMVASSHPLATQAGLVMLQAGGNAVDAALATAITLVVVEPTGNGLGSDAFCILWDGKEL